MTNAIIKSIVSRSTTKKYDPALTLSDDQIRELVRIATTAPTSFQMQNWRFIAVRTPMDTASSAARTITGAL
jgi:nitroreductase